MIFTKPLTEQHGTGLLLIAMGIVLKMLPGDSKPSKRSSTLNSQAKIQSLSHGDEVEDDERYRALSVEEQEKRPLV